MSYQVILFDFDGTLFDTAPGMLRTTYRVLQAFGITVQSQNELQKLIGPPFREAVMRFYGVEPERAAEMSRQFIAEYERDGLDAYRIYDGTVETLERLRRAGKCLCVATSKPEALAKRVLDRENMSRFFACIAGSVPESFGTDGQRVKKGEVIAYALKQLCAASGESAVMVGDRKYDIAGAKENGMHSIGLLSGYGSRSELECAGATYILETIAQIEQIVL